MNDATTTALAARTARVASVIAAVTLALAAIGAVGGVVAGIKVGSQWEYVSDGPYGTTTKAYPNAGLGWVLGLSGFGSAMALLVAYVLLSYVQLRARGLTLPAPVTAAPPPSTVNAGQATTVVPQAGPQNPSSGVIGMGSSALPESRLGDDAPASLTSEHRTFLGFQSPPGDRSPGWYIDPLGGPYARRWDGAVWTVERRALAGS